ncbi:MAG TPA: hypothetical protein VG651_18665, partial [Stellaceae bacterium]|nr:hypothetical protein [Stellaceae bacterium]
MRRPIRRCRRVAAFLALVWLSVSCGTAFVQGANLVANPLFTRDMPVPGWIGDHREAWVREHPVYRARCENAEVIKEVRYLNRVIAYDEYLLSLTTASDASASPADKLANVARQSQSSIRRDIVVVDALVAQLRLLPSCDEVMAPRPAPVSMIPAQPMRDAGAAASDAPVRPHDAPAPAVR